MLYFHLFCSMGNLRQYIQARNLRNEAMTKLQDYEAVMGRTKKEFETLRNTGIQSKAFELLTVKVLCTKLCWNHVFKNPTKRQSRIEKLERAFCFPLAVKLMEKTTTYQEVSREKDKGGNNYLYFGVIGYIRGNRIKVIIRKQDKVMNPHYVLYSFYQLSQAPTKIRNDVHSRRQAKE